MPPEEQPTAYCVKCKDKKEIQDPQDVVLKNGRPARHGTCGDCGTKVFRMMAKSPSA